MPKPNHIYTIPQPTKTPLFDRLNGRASACEKHGDSACLACREAMSATKRRSPREASREPSWDKVVSAMFPEFAAKADAITADMLHAQQSLSLSHAMSAFSNAGFSDYANAPSERLRPIPLFVFRLLDADAGVVAIKHIQAWTLEEALASGLTFDVQVRATVHMLELPDRKRIPLVSGPQEVVAGTRISIAKFKCPK